MCRRPVPVRFSAIRSRVSITAQLNRTALAVAFSILAVGLAAAPPKASAAKITWRANPDIEESDALRIAFAGAIALSDVSAVERLLSRYPKYTPHLVIDSQGGDIDAAMAIGRLLRAKDAKVRVSEISEGKCLSSCVLIYASGVIRENDAQWSNLARAGIGSGIGIHRFYFASLRESATTAEIQASRNMQKERIKAYLSDMNVSNE